MTRLGMMKESEEAEKHSGKNKTFKIVDRQWTTETWKQTEENHNKEAKEEQR